MKTLLAAPDLVPDRGGIQRLLHGISREWAEGGLAVVVPSERVRGFVEKARAANRALGAVASNAAILLLNARVAVAARRADAVLAGHVNLVPGALLARWLFRKPFVLYLYAQEIPLHPRLTRIGVAKSARTIVISEYTAELARGAGAADDKLVLIHPGVDPPRGVAEAPPNEVPTIVTVARLVDEYKGHDRMLDALAMLQRDAFAVRWQVVGDGPLRARLEDKAASLGLAGEVEFLGSVSDDERDRLLARCDLFVLPNRVREDGGGEGFGIVLLEAGNYGVPVIAGRTGGTADAVVDGDTGLLVDASDPAELASAIRRVLSDRDTASRMGRSGARNAAAHSWASISGQVQEVMAAAAAGR